METLELCNRGVRGQDLEELSRLVHLSHEKLDQNHLGPEGTEVLSMVLPP